MTEVVQDEFKSRILDVLDGEAILIARGGKGGRGNASYATSTNQQPVLAQKGGRGEERCLLLELKLLSDVALIGKPNAGKSTLLSKCSAAKPKIADYPFTTVEPLLGVVDDRGMNFVMMEVPGLLEGAHQGVGLGQEFLRHAERTRVYWHILDGFSENPVADLKAVNQELRLFNPELQTKPQIVVVNKMDITQVRAEKEVLEDRLKRALAASGKSKDLNTEGHQYFSYLQLLVKGCQTCWTLRSACWTR